MYTDKPYLYIIRTRSLEQTDQFYAVVDLAVVIMCEVNSFFKATAFVVLFLVNAVFMTSNPFVVGKIVIVISLAIKNFIIH